MNKHISNDTELKEYFNHCKENGIEIWYTKKFKITKNTLSGGVDQLYDWEGLYEQIGIGLYNDGYRKYADRGHHFWLAKWLINDIMYNGIKIPFQVSMIRVKTWLDRGFSLDQLKSHYTINNRSKYGYKVHPGTGKINYCNFLRMYEVPAMITVLKDDNLRFDGEILDYTGYKRILNGVREYYSDGGVQIFYSNDYLDPLVKIDIGTTHCD